MAISEELRQVIAILEEEGFGALAGELLTEVSLGRAVEKRLESTGQLADVEDVDTAIIRVPIEEADQLAEAMQFLRLRLVQPVRAFAEAERIAADLSGKKGVRIRFVDPVEQVEIEPISRTDSGVSSVADALDALLERLPAMSKPPSSAGI